MIRRRFVLAMLLLVGLGAVVPAAGTAAGPVDQAVTMSTNYDGTTPSQEVQVTLTIEPEQSKLTDVVIEFQSGPRTLIQTDSYSSTVTPSNHDVSISSDGRNRFTIPELRTGERVQIAFTVVPSTLAEHQLTPATASVELTRNGQRLDASVSEPVTLTGNPWDRAQSSQRPGWLFLAGTGVLGAGVAGGVAVAYYRRKVATERDRIMSTLSKQIDSVKRAGDATVERRAERAVTEVRSSVDLDDETTDGGGERDGGIRSRLSELLGSDSTPGGPGPTLGGTSSDDDSGPEL
jgi:hypothetical protein